MNPLLPLTRLDAVLDPVTADALRAIRDLTGCAECALHRKDALSKRLERVRSLRFHNLCSKIAKYRQSQVLRQKSLVLVLAGVDLLLQVAGYLGREN